VRKTYFRKWIAVSKKVQSSFPERQVSMNKRALHTSTRAVYDLVCLQWESAREQQLECVSMGALCGQVYARHVHQVWVTRATRVPYSRMLF
jgi:hypothetical protein